jgi:hypothetical protein
LINPQIDFVRPFELIAPAGAAALRLRSSGASLTRSGHAESTYNLAAEGSVSTDDGQKIHCHLQIVPTVGVVPGVPQRLPSTGAVHRSSSSPHDLSSRHSLAHRRRFLRVPFSIGNRRPLLKGKS